MPDASETMDSSLLSLDGDGGGQWDQFAVNRDKFGVESTFNEELYTTALDKSSCGISEQEAARIAREIETQTGGSSNYHLLEERGGELDGDDVSTYGFDLGQGGEGARVGKLQGGQRGGIARSQMDHL
jgi:PAB1-binding protein PBP1